MNLKYNENSRISSVEDVKKFFNYLAKDLSVNFHPDESFENTISYETQEPTFSPEEAEILNGLMADCRTACDAAGEDIYDLAFDAVNSILDAKATPVEEAVQRTEFNDFYTWIQPDMLEKIRDAIDKRLDNDAETTFLLQDIVAVLKSGEVGN